MLTRKECFPPREGGQIPGGLVMSAGDEVAYVSHAPRDRGVGGSGST